MKKRSGAKTGFLHSVLKIQFNPTSNPNWRQDYQTLISNLKVKPSAFSLQACHDALKLYENYSSFTKKIDVLDFERASKVVDYIFDNNIILHTLERRGELNVNEHFAMFHGMRKFLEVDDRGLALSRELLPGAYQLWRRSVSIPGDFVKGAIFIENVKSVNVLKVEMLQQFAPRDQINLNPVNSRREALNGYIFRQSDGRYIMALRQVGRRHLRVSFLTEVAHLQGDDGRIGKVDWMRGHVMGLDNNKSIFANVYLERVSDETSASGDDAIRHLLETINVYEEDEVPSNVKKILSHDALSGTGITL